MKQEMVGWQCHYLNHIICTLLQTDNHTSSSSLNLYTLGDLQSTEGKAFYPFKKPLTEKSINLIFRSHVCRTVISTKTPGGGLA